MPYDLLRGAVHTPVGHLEELCTVPFISSRQPHAVTLKTMHADPTAHLKSAVCSSLYGSRNKDESSSLSYLYIRLCRGNNYHICISLRGSAYSPLRGTAHSPIREAVCSHCIPLRGAVPSPSKEAVHTPCSPLGGAVYSPLKTGSICDCPPSKARGRKVSLSFSFFYLLKQFTELGGH